MMRIMFRCSERFVLPKFFTTKLPYQRDGILSAKRNETQH